jgi:hypothetical protein
LQKSQAKRTRSALNGPYLKRGGDETPIGQSKELRNYNKKYQYSPRQDPQTEGAGEAEERAEGRNKELTEED